MNRIVLIALSISIISTLAVPAFAADARLEATSGALATVTQGDWSAGIRLQRDRREFQVGSDLLGLDVDHLLFRFGVAPLSFLSLHGEVGVCTADSTSEKGEGGLEWGLGGYLRVADFAIETSPVVGVKEAISFGIDIAYSQCESNFPDTDLDWSEWRVNPLISYTRNREGENRWFFYAPEALAVRAGPAFVSSEGDYGEQSLQENRDFGARLICDMLWPNDWVLRLDGLFLGSEERQLGLAIERNF